MDAYAVTELIVEEDIMIPINIWTYTALDLWLDDMHIVSVKKAVYKPIKRVEKEVLLSKGKHRLFARIQNVGVRNTRNIFGVQLKAYLDKIEVSLPDREKLEDVLVAEEWLSTASYANSKEIY